MKIRPVGAEWERTDRRPDGRKEIRDVADSRSSKFCERD